MRFRLAILAFSFLLVSSLLPSGGVRAQAAEPPRLVVVVVLERFRYDYIDRFWEKFGEGGFRRLVGEGTAYRNATHGYKLAQLGTGHATLSTGTQPRTHGIVASQWLDPATGQFASCAADREARTVGSASDLGRFSPAKLLANTLGDQLKLSSMGRSKVVSIAMRPEAATLMGGHMADAAYWFDESYGRWISSDHYLDQLPEWVNQFNYRHYPEDYLTRVWSTAFPLHQYTECLGDDNPYERNFPGAGHVFPYSLDDINKATPGFSAFHEVPASNTFLTDMAIEAIKGESLGKDEHADLLWLSYGATAHIAERFGPLSVEMADLVVRLDMDLYKLISNLESLVGKGKFVLALVADRGDSYPPAYLESLGLPAGEFTYRTSLSLLKVHLSNRYGSQEWVKAYRDQQYFLDRGMLERKSIALPEARAYAQELLRQFTGVNRVLTLEQLREGAATDPEAQRMANSFHPERSGDLMLNLVPNWREQSDRSTTNTGYRDDTHVPLVLFGAGVPMGLEVHRAVDVTQLAPTLAALLRVPHPNSSQAEPLVEALER